MRLIDADIFLSKIEPDEYYHTNEIMDIMTDIFSEGNVPLTLEELRGMDGELVWIESFRNAKNGKYVIFDGYDQVLHCFRVIGGGLLDCTVMGKTWLAYRRRPEEGKT